MKPLTLTLRGINSHLREEDMWYREQVSLSFKWKSEGVVDPIYGEGDSNEYDELARMKIDERKEKVGPKVKV